MKVFIDLVFPKLELLQRKLLINFLSINDTEKRINFEDQWCHLCGTSIYKEQTYEPINTDKNVLAPKIYYSETTSPFSPLDLFYKLSQSILLEPTELWPPGRSKHFLLHFLLVKSFHHEGDKPPINCKLFFTGIYNLLQLFLF